MSVLEEQITVDRPVHEVFAYIADFTTTEEWDSTAQTARKLTAGPLGVGTRFLVNCALPVGSVDIEYEITRFVPDQQVVLAGSSRFFSIEDDIRFSPTSDGGTQIDYRAAFQFPQPMAALAKRFDAGLQRMGKASMRGMLRALEDDFPTPQTSNRIHRADKLVLPGLAGFTRLGYTRGKRYWHPVSAYVGDKHMVVTGASGGLGYATAMELARRGARLTLVMRNAKKADKVVADIVAETGNKNLSVELADLSLIGDVDKLVTRLLKRGDTIDVLVNNAGALFNPRQETAEGIENSLALLLLSPYRLTEGLRPLLEKSETPRVINVVSGGMYSEPLQVSKLGADEGDDYSGATAYARCKRALMVQTEFWAEQWADSGIAVNAMHPGWADTPGVEDSLPEFHKLTRKVLRTPEEGADTIIWLAVATEAQRVSGKLFLDREPRTTHLLAKTRGRDAQREALKTFLQDYPWPKATRKRGPKTAASAA